MEEEAVKVPENVETSPKAQKKLKKTKRKAFTAFDE